MMLPFGGRLSLDAAVSTRSARCGSPTCSDHPPLNWPVFTYYIVHVRTYRYYICKWVYVCRWTYTKFYTLVCLYCSYIHMYIWLWYTWVFNKRIPYPNLYLFANSPFTLRFATHCLLLIYFHYDFIYLFIVSRFCVSFVLHFQLMFEEWSQCSYMYICTYIVVQE